MSTVMIQCADCGPLESIVSMFHAIGWQCLIPDASLRARLISAGCDTVLDPEFLFREMGYDRPQGVVASGDLDSVDLYADVKAHRNGPKVWEIAPRLKGRTMWYRINGGMPEITPQGGDELHFEMPIITPNVFYRDDPTSYADYTGNLSGENWGGLAYVCWPPFARATEFLDVAAEDRSQPPVCLIHNVNGWGYRDLVEPLRDAVGLKCFGSHGSPDGLVAHRDVLDLLTKARCMVHLKSNDCPGYSLYEAIFAGCPLVVSRRLIKRMRMQELFVEDETCLCFDVEGDSRGCGPLDVEKCTVEVRAAIDMLADDRIAETLADKALDRLTNLIWDEHRDADDFAAFVGTHL